MMSARLWTYIAILVIADISSPAEAAQKRKPRLDAMVSLNGQCEKLVMPESDITSSCTGKVMNTVYNEGRSGFCFVLEDSAVLTFSGNGNVNPNPNPDTAVQPVDLILFNYKGDVDRTQAVGQCDFQNPYKGPSRLICRAGSSVGNFHAEFVSDGTQPHVVRQ
jgi:hypothetical protein